MKPRLCSLFFLVVGCSSKSTPSTRDLAAFEPADAAGFEVDLDGGADLAPATDCAGPAPVANHARGGDTPVYVNAATYDYSPSVMLDGVYRMWWCCGSTSGGVSGDHICYAEASSLDGPWHAHGSTAANSHDEVFHGTGNPADFDGTHTCDPSVVRVDGTYYMFYGGISENTASPTWTRIGVAQSSDGFSWTRLNNGRAIIDAARDPYANHLPNTYGAGQPSVVFLDGKYLLVHTDTSGLGGNPGNGAGQYVLRSADPTFQVGVEELTGDGFVARGQTTYTGFSLVEAFAIDWQYADAIDRFVVADDGPNAAAMTIKLFSRDLKPVGVDVSIPGHWTEEPAIASRPDKHALPWGGACATLPLEVMRSVGAGGQPATWDLAHAGIDLELGRTCQCLPLGRMLEGTLLAVPDLPLALVRDGSRLHFALGPPATRLARTEVNPGAAVYNALPYGASIYSGNKALGASGRPGAYLLDDGKRWPVSCVAELTDNHSTITFIDVASYDAYAQGPPLYCLQ